MEDGGVHDLEGQQQQDTQAAAHLVRQGEAAVVPPAELPLKLLVRKALDDSEKRTRSNPKYGVGCARAAAEESNNMCRPLQLWGVLCCAAKKWQTLFKGTGTLKISC